MATGSRIRPRPATGHVALVEGFRDIPTPIISDNLARLASAGPDLRPLHGSARLAGLAFTVRTRPGDNLLVHKAIDVAEPGDVVVVDAGGDLTNAILGEIMMQIARRRGLAGFVVDGAIRDVAAFRAAGFPVFARGVNHRGPYKDGPGEINGPVRIGQMVVEPGDLLIGDDDGLVGIRPADAPAVLEAARAQMAREAETLRAIEEGRLDRSWVDRALAARGLED